jgi:hypothetical protein
MFPIETKSRVEFKSNVPPLNEPKFGTRGRDMKLRVGNPEGSWFLLLVALSSRFLRFPTPRFRFLSDSGSRF